MADFERITQIDLKPTKLDGKHGTNGTDRLDGKRESVEEFQQFVFLVTAKRFVAGVLPKQIVSCATYMPIQSAAGASALQNLAEIRDCSYH